MSIHIQTADGLKPLASNKITQENVVEALDYTPANKTELDAHIVNEDIHTTAADKAKWNAKSDFSGNYNDLTNKPDIIEDGSDNLVIADPDGNVIFKVDSEGVHTTALEVDGIDVGAALQNVADNAELDAHLTNTTVHITESERTAWNNKSDFSGNYNDLADKPNITEDGSAEINIVDNDGNIIFKVDADGAQTTELTLGTGETAVKVTEKLDALGQDTSLVNVALSGHTEDTTAHITAAERDTWNAKADTTYVDETVAEQIASKANKTDLDSHITNTSNPHNVTATQVGLGLVDNTSDMDKPVSTATQEALDGLKTELSESIVSESKEWIIADEDGNIVAKVDENGLETTTVTADAVVVNGIDVETALSGKSDTEHSHTITANASDDDVVVLTGTNGTDSVTYTASHATSGVSAGTYKSVTVNEYGHVTGGTNPTTLAGYGITDAVSKTDFESHTNNQENPHNVTPAQIGLGSVDNTSDANKPVSTAQQAALDNLKSELSESIVSESEEWTIVDNSGNIVARVDANGLETTTVTAQNVIVNGVDLGDLGGGDMMKATYDKDGDGVVDKAENATSANKINTDAGSTTQPVYFANGVPVETTYTLGKSVPSDAEFTDTTYSNATTTEDGLMSARDKLAVNWLHYTSNEESGGAGEQLKIAPSADTAHQYIEFDTNDGSLVVKGQQLALLSSDEDIVINSSTGINIGSNEDISIICSSNLTITAPDGVSVNGKEVATTDVATQSAAGLMSAVDKTNLDNILDFVMPTKDDGGLSGTIGAGDNYINIDTSIDIVAMGSVGVVADNGEFTYNGNEVATKEDIPTFTYDATTKVLTIS